MECPICLDPVSTKKKKRKSVTECCNGVLHTSCMKAWSDTNLVGCRCPRCNTTMPDTRINTASLLVSRWVADTFFCHQNLYQNRYNMLGFEHRLCETDVQGIQEMTEDAWTVHLILFQKKHLTLRYPPITSLSKAPRINLTRLHQDTDFMDKEFTTVHFHQK